MWSLTITSPRSEPLQIKLVPGRMLIGRQKTCDIVIDELVASRRHAELFFDPLSDLVTLKDLNSVNGTYVNRRRATNELMRLQDGDVLRIGQTVMHLARLAESPGVQKDITGTQLFSRDLVLEAVDEHPILLNEIMEKLNPVVDPGQAIHLLIGILTRAMGVDLCEIIPASDFANIQLDSTDGLLARSLRNDSIETAPLEMCLPVMGGGKPLALIHLARSRPGAAPFTRRDVQMAVAISNQTALTLQRIRLIETVRREARGRENLLRLLSPLEAGSLLKEYPRTGELPEPTLQKVSLLVVSLLDPGRPSARTAPAFHASFLKPFTQAAARAVLEHAGLPRLLGDGLLAFFPNVDGEPPTEQRAVLAARAIIQYVKHDAPFEIDQVGVTAAAVTTRQVLAGYAGSGDWMQFNVIGDLVWQTFRLQAHAFPNRLLVDAATAAALQDRVVLGEALSLELQPGEPPQPTHEILGWKDDPAPRKKEEDRKDQKELPDHMAAAFRSVAEKLRSRGKKDDRETD